MTVVEYNTKVEEYELEQKAIYIQALNKFNANVTLSGGEGRFVKRNTAFFNFDAEGSLEEMRSALELAEAKVKDMTEDVTAFNVESYYEIIATSDGYDCAEVDEAYFIVSWGRFKSMEEVDFKQGESVLKLALNEAINGRPIYSINSNAKRMYLDGSFTWEQLVAFHTT